MWASWFCPYIGLENGKVIFEIKDTGIHVVLECFSVHQISYYVDVLKLLKAETIKGQYCWSLSALEAKLKSRGLVKSLTFTHEAFKEPNVNNE